MKKILQYFILTIMTVCFSLPAFSSADGRYRSVAAPGQ